MTGNTLKTRDVATMARTLLATSKACAVPPDGTTATQIYSDAVRGMDMHYFDMTLPDGKVYRVRVSDITPNEGG